MKRLSCCWFIALLLPLAAYAETRPAPPSVALRGRPSSSELSASDPLTLTIPAETQATVQILSGLHTRFSRVDDPVKAQLTRAVVVEGKVALPPGTLLDGRVTRVRAAGRFNRPAEFALRFDQITLPDGNVEPIAAVLASAPPHTRLDREGYLKGTRTISWKGVAGGLAAVGSVAASAALWPVLPAAGTSLLAYEFLWRRGGEVHLPPETPCQIRLDYPLTVRLAW